MYLALKAVHVLAVALFLGNIVIGLFWKRHADRTGDARIMAHTLAGIVRSDQWFTLPAAAVIVLSGVLAARGARLPLLGTPWIAASIGLFVASGTAFAWQVAPLQMKMRALAAEARDGQWDAARYRRLSLRWEVWGAFAVATPLAALWLMIVKPGS